MHRARQLGVDGGRERSARSASHAAPLGADERRVVRLVPRRSRSAGPRPPVSAAASTSAISLPVGRQRVGARRARLRGMASSRARSRRRAPRPSPAWTSPRRAPASRPRAGATPARATGRARRPAEARPDVAHAAGCGACRSSRARPPWAGARRQSITSRKYVRPDRAQRVAHARPRRGQRASVGTGDEVRVELRDADRQPGPAAGGAGGPAWRSATATGSAWGSPASRAAAAGAAPSACSNADAIVTPSAASASAKQATAREKGATSVPSRLRGEA